LTGGRGPKRTKGVGNGAKKKKEGGTLLFGEKNRKRIYEKQTTTLERGLK